jgi:protein-tyrosine-phosphatase
MRVLFVCTGNTCRSALAETLARKIAIERGLSDIESSSAGTSAWEGASASDGALLVGLERGLDLNGHRARQLDRDLVQGADLVLAMGPHHLERIEALGGTGRAFLLTEYASHGAESRPVNDPMGAELDVYRATADELERELRRVFDRLAAERGSESA